MSFRRLRFLSLDDLDRRNEEYRDDDELDDDELVENLIDRLERTEERELGEIAAILARGAKPSDVAGAMRAPPAVRIASPGLKRYASAAVTSAPYCRSTWRSSRIQ